MVIGPELRSLIKIRSAIQWPSIAPISGWVSVILQNGSQGSGRGGGEVLTVVTVVQVSANGQIGNVGDAQMQSAASVVDITTLRQLDPSLVEFRIERQFISAQKLMFEYSRQHDEIISNEDSFKTRQ